MPRKIHSLVRPFVCLLMAGVAAFVNTAVYAQQGKTETNPKGTSSGFAVGLRGGTLGAGAELAKALTTGVNAKVLVNGFAVRHDFELDEIDYEVDIDLFSLGLLLDWYPFSKGFYLSGGLFFNGNKLDATAEIQDELEIGNRLYTFEEVGELDGNIDFASLAPYAGLGWRNHLGSNQRWALLFDAGVILQSNSEVKLSPGNQEVFSLPGFAEDLEREEESLEDKIDNFGFYPVLSIGLLFKF